VEQVAKDALSLISSIISSPLALVLELVRLALSLASALAGSVLGRVNSLFALGLQNTNTCKSAEKGRVSGIERAPSSQPTIVEKRAGRQLLSATSDSYRTRRCAVCLEAWAAENIDQA
jgi:hypothetical protein